MSEARSLRVVDSPTPTRRLTGEYWWDPDRDRHLQDRPKHCPECGASIEPRGLAVEYWEADRRIYHTWCAGCGWAGDITVVRRLIGYEPEH